MSTQISPSQRTRKGQKLSALSVFQHKNESYKKQLVESRFKKKTRRLAFQAVNRKRVNLLGKGHCGHKSFPAFKGRIGQTLGVIA